MPKNKQKQPSSGRRAGESSSSQKDDQHQSSSHSSDQQSSEQSAASVEAKQMLKRAAQLKKDLLRYLEQHAEEETVLQALKAYVAYVSETAQYFMDNSKFKPAQRILTVCKTCLTSEAPQKYGFHDGNLFIINNNLAQLSNKLGDVNQSVAYLEQAVESSRDARVQNKDELPLAETYLNLANACAFLNEHEKAIKYAEQATVQATQHCARLEHSMQNPQLSQHEAELLNEQFYSQINLKITALHTSGTNFEKMSQYQQALSKFKLGKQFIEQTFGTEHQLYAVFCSAMGGVKLKTKYQTPAGSDGFKRKQSKSRSRSSGSSSGNSAGRKSKVPAKPIKKVAAKRNQSKKKNILANGMNKDMSSLVNDEKSEIIEKKKKVKKVKKADVSESAKVNSKRRLDKLEKVQFDFSDDERHVKRNAKAQKSAMSARRQPSINLIVGENVQTKKRLRPNSAMTRSQLNESINVKKPNTIRGFSAKMLESASAWQQNSIRQIGAIPSKMYASMDFGPVSIAREAGNTREARFRLLRSGSTRGIYKDEDQRYLKHMRENSKHKLVVCENGPTCKNHDWDHRSPIVKVCKRDHNCPNHDWYHTDRTNSPFRVVCKFGPGCKNHDWSRRSPMHRLALKCAKRKRIIKKKDSSSSSSSSKHSEQKPPSPPKPEPVKEPSEKAPSSSSSSSSSSSESSSPSEHCDHPYNCSCLVHQQERMNLMQMSQMRQLQEDQFRMYEASIIAHNNMLFAQQQPQQPQQLQQPQQPQQQQMADAATSAYNQTFQSIHKTPSRYEPILDAQSSFKQSPEPVPIFNGEMSRQSTIGHQTMNQAGNQSIRSIRTSNSNNQNLQSTFNDRELQKNASQRDIKHSTISQRGGNPSMSMIQDDSSHTKQELFTNGPQSHKSHKSQKSINSYHNDSDDSFHAAEPTEQELQMKGVTKIQNIWRKKQAEKEKNVRFNAAHQTSKVLFRIAFNGQQLTCVNYTKNGLLDMLKFQGKEEKVTVNLLEKAIPYNESDLSADVQRIISSATCLSEIPQLFNQDLAKKILKEQGQGHSFSMNFKEISYDDQGNQSYKYTGDTFKLNNKEFPAEFQEQVALRRSAVEKEIDFITKENRFQLYEIDEIWHRQNQQVMLEGGLSVNLANEDKPAELQPIKIDRVVVTKKEKKHQAVQKMVQQNIERKNQEKMLRGDDSDSYIYEDQENYIGQAEERRPIHDVGDLPDESGNSAKSKSRHSSSSSSSSSGSSKSKKSGSDSSLHSYEFHVGVDYTHIPKPSNLTQVTQLQALLRGFYDRSKHFLNQKIPQQIYKMNHRRLYLDWEVTLIKYREHKYLLKAKCTNKYHLKSSDEVLESQHDLKRLIYDLPFQEHELYLQADTDPRQEHELMKLVNQYIKIEQDDVGEYSVDFSKERQINMPECEMPDFEEVSDQQEESDEDFKLKMGSEVLWIDTVRNKINYRVVVFRSRDEGFRYVLKIGLYEVGSQPPSHSFNHYTLQEPIHYMHVRSLPENSHSIRHQIFNELIIKTNQFNQPIDAYWKSEGAQLAASKIPSYVPYKPQVEQPADQNIPVPMPRKEESNTAIQIQIQEAVGKYELTRKDILQGINSIDIGTSMIRNGIKLDNQKKKIQSESRETILSFKKSNIAKVIQDRYFNRTTKQSFAFVMSFDCERNEIHFSLTNHTNSLPLAQELVLDTSKLPIMVEVLYDDEKLRQLVIQRTKSVISKQSQNLSDDYLDEFKLQLEKELLKVAKQSQLNDSPELKGMLFPDDESIDYQQQEQQLDEDGHFVQQTRMKKLLIETKPVKIKGMMTNKFMYHYVFEGDASTNQFTFSLYNQSMKRQICEKAPCQTDLFKQIDDYEIARDNVKKRIELHIKRSGHEFSDKVNSGLPECLKNIDSSGLDEE